MVGQVPWRAGSPSAARAGGGAGRVRFAGFLHGAVVGLAGLGLVCARGRMRRGGEHGGGAGPGSDGPTPGTFVSSVTSGRSSAAAAMVWRTRASSSALSWRSWRSAAWVRSIRVGVRRWPSCWVRAVISASSWPRQARISPSVSRGPDRTGVGAGRAHYRAVAGDHGGIQPVGLGREPAGFGNLAHPFRVDDRSQHALRQESPVRSPPVAAGRFHHHQAGGVVPGCVDQQPNPGRIVARRQPPPAGQTEHVQRRLADVDTHDLAHPPSPPCPWP